MMSAEQYLKELETRGITPNWWCSEEYFRRAGLKVMNVNGSIVVVDLQCDINSIMFPLLSERQGFAQCLNWLDNFGIKCWNDFKIWTDFPEYKGEAGVLETELFDYEYIYDPKKFLDMSGKTWQVFRKNSRKYPARYGKEISYVDSLPGDYGDCLKELFEEWTADLSTDTVQDVHVLMDFYFEGDNRKYLLDSDGELLGVNVWDENYKYINYRYCICRRQPFLSEYLRLLFYLDMVKRDKLVNDGGVLGNDRLRQFKDKLNPVGVREVKSYSIKIMHKETK